MGKKAVSVGEKMMHARLRQKLGNPYAKPYNRHKIVYFAFSVYAFLLFAVQEIMFVSMSLFAGEYKGTQVEQTFFNLNFLVVQAMVVLFVLSFVFMLLKMDWPAVCLGIGSGLFLLIHLVQIVIGEYNNKSYLFVAYLLVGTMYYAAVYMLVVMIKQKKRLHAAIEKEYQKIYQKYADREEATLLTEEQLAQILEVYETAMKSGVAPPKTLDEIRSTSNHEKGGA